MNPAALAVWLLFGIVGFLIGSTTGSFGWSSYCNSDIINRYGDVT